MRKFVIVGNDNWWGLYKSGKLVHEGHDGPHGPLFRAVLEAGGFNVDIRYADYEWLCDESGGRLPSKLKDVKYGKPL